MNELLKEMQNIGFTNYEAKIYIALLQKNPATGYEISKLSGVPQAKVYENISRLSDSGTVLTIGSEPSKYVPLPPEELLKTTQANFEKSIRMLRERLSALNRVQRLDYVWNIKGFDLTMEKAIQMIHEAQSELTLSLWEEEILYLHDEIIEAVNRRVDVNILLYGKIKIEGLDIHYHGSEEKLKKQVGGRWLTIVVDKKEVLTGEVNRETEGVSIWTANQSIVFISLRAIEHEIYISNKFEGRDKNENY